MATSFSYTSRKTMMISHTDYTPLPACHRYTLLFGFAVYYILALDPHLMQNMQRIYPGRVVNQSETGEIVYENNEQLALNLSGYGNYREVLINSDCTDSPLYIRCRQGRPLHHLPAGHDDRTH